MASGPQRYSLLKGTSLQYQVARSYLERKVQQNQSYVHGLKQFLLTLFSGTKQRNEGCITNSTVDHCSNAHLLVRQNCPIEFALFRPLRVRM